MKTIENSRHILQKAIATYGTGPQTAKTVEEVGELMTAHGRLTAAIMRKKLSDEELVPLASNLQEEIADCIIMLEQMKMMYGEEQVDSWIDYKLDRLEGRLREKEGDQDDTGI